MRLKYQEVVRDMATVMAQEKEPAHLLRKVTHFLNEKMAVRKAAIAVYDRVRGSFVFYDSRGEKKIPEQLVRLDLDNPVVKWFSRDAAHPSPKRHILDAKEIDHILEQDHFFGMKGLKAESLEEIERVMRGLGVRACFPGYYKKELLGLLFVGEKKNKRSFRPEEIAFLETMASDISMAIKASEYQVTLEEKVAQLEESLSTIQQLREKDRSKYLQMIVTLADIVDAKDPYTRGHSEEVERLGLACLKYMKLDWDEQRRSNFATALKLHDFGKCGIPDEILKKPAPLTPEEMVIMREHVTIGADILSSHEDLRVVADIIRHHHEMFDGSGYPGGLAGHDIPLESRIICVVDAFHAMFSDRPYRKGLPLAVCLEELKKKQGIQFDPVAVEAFMHVAENDLYLEE